MLNAGNLQGKTAWVGGASQGIGRAVANALAAHGCRVISVARTEATLRTATDALNQRYPVTDGHAYVAVDTGDVFRLTQAVVPWVGKVDILVNNTGGAPAGLICEAGVSDFETAFMQHVLANVTLANAFWPGMKSQGFGRIINIVSTSVKSPIPYLGVSNTVRWAVAAWAKTLSYELAAFGITVNSVLPGSTDTDRIHELYAEMAEREGKTTAQVTAEQVGMIPAKRLAMPEEIADVVAFLASPQAAYVNGVALPVDGGKTRTL
ncbi:MAG: hypothetical protein A3J38_02025 [Gammaproteobacteria bacterium RIFCSPHIGHO2_12_FULL_45_9]|nr:MAG: hypothetical protein A3J38_02025 [Gammaproteobacteria bacterium RIFCSPHIGHO2_12_FULL_45_9]